MDSAGRGWLLMLAGLLPLSIARGEEATAPALLPPATFAARIAAQRLTPAPFDPAADAVATVAEIPSLPATHQPVVLEPPPSFSLQREYERAMTETWQESIDYVPFAFRSEAAFAATAGAWRPRHSNASERP